MPKSRGSGSGFENPEKIPKNNRDSEFSRIFFSWDGISRQKASSAFSFINFIILIYQLMRLKNSDGWNRVTKYGAVFGKHGTNDVWFDIDYAGGDCNGCCPTCCH